MKKYVQTMLEWMLVVGIVAISFFVSEGVIYMAICNYINEWPSISVALIGKVSIANILLASLLTYVNTKHS